MPADAFVMVYILDGPAAGKSVPLPVDSAGRPPSRLKVENRPEVWQRFGLGPSGRWCYVLAPPHETDPATVSATRPAPSGP
jgi:hypothetical protein